MEKKLKELRKMCLKLSYICQDGNLQSAFSCMEIVWKLYNGIMNWSPEMANKNGRDYFIISKGQATLALYVVLLEKGMFKEEDMQEMGQFNSRYCIQTDPTKFPEGGIENAAGSLGHGLPFGVGLAYSSKIKKDNAKVYVLTGDGEFCEGTMWESCILASGKKLDNLYVIIDDNHSVGSMIPMEDMKIRLQSFGFEVAQIDGHDIQELERAIKELNTPEKPKAILASTIRGYGSKTLMEQDVWFHKAPNEQELNMLCQEVDLF